jgi:hypothetical protein
MTDSQDIKTYYEISPGASTILDQYDDIHLNDILNMKMRFLSVAFSTTKYTKHCFNILTSLSKNKLFETA